MSLHLSHLFLDYYLSNGQVCYGVGGKEKGALLSEGIEMKSWYHFTIYGIFGSWKHLCFHFFEQFPFEYKVSWKDISLFFDPKGPIWCLIDLYGSCSAIELEETSTVAENQEEPGQSVEATAPPMTQDMYRTISTTTTTISTTNFDRQLTPPPSYENLFSNRGNTWTMSANVEFEYISTDMFYLYKW